MASPCSTWLASAASFAAAQPVGRVRADAVDARPAVDVVAGASCEPDPVGAGAGPDPVAAAARVDSVGSSTGRNPVAAGAGRDSVGALTRFDDVVATAAANEVAAAAGGDTVGRLAADDHVGCWRAAREPATLGDDRGELAKTGGRRGRIVSDRHLPVAGLDAVLDAHLRGRGDHVARPA